MLPESYYAVPVRFSESKEKSSEVVDIVLVLQVYV